MFQNREEAGILLAEKIKKINLPKKTLVVAIPRGGVIVGKQIAQKLSLPLSILPVKKLGAPGNPELAIGAITISNTKYVDWEIAERNGADKEYIAKVIKEKKRELEEKSKKFEFLTSKLPLSDFTTFILTDDGVATGATTKVAIQHLREKAKLAGQNFKIILAVPVIAKDTFKKIKSEVEEIVALTIPDYFGAVGEFYREFAQVSDEEVIELLRNVAQNSI